MQFRILGPVDVLDRNGQSIDIGGSQPRSLLAMLIVAGGRVVPVDSIIDRLWPDGQPATAAGTLQSYVSRLRRVLEPHRAEGGPAKMLSWESSGYRLHVADENVDYRRFEHAADLGRAELNEGAVVQARRTLADALDLWRGEALPEFAEQPWARGVATRLDERRLTALEDRIRADLLLGRHDVVIGELSDLVDENPLREGLWEQFAIALYRSGRQAEALRALAELRRQLLDGLGIDPSIRIRELESQILAHDPLLAAPAAPEPSGSGAARAEIAVSPAPRGSRHYRGLITDEIVGRAAERVRLDRVLERATGSAQWVLIEGEAGIGKTRLLEYLADEADRLGFAIVWARSHESGAAPAFWPWLPALRALLDVVTDLPADVRELIDNLLDPSDAIEAVAPVDTGRFRLFGSIALLLEHAAQTQPLMIALDDMQWADPASLELIDCLTGYVVGAPIVFAATIRQLEIGRNDALVQTLAQISRRPSTERMQLDGLERVDADHLVRRTIGDGAPADVVRAIYERSDGNPFFMTELARLVAAEDGLTETELIRRAEVPAGVRDVVHRRLARLPKPTLDLVQIAAAIGRRTHVTLLSDAAGLSIDECLDRIEPALLDRLLVEQPNVPGMIQFSHALVREVVVDELSSLRRARLHLRAANAIEAHSPAADDNAEIVADHLWHAASLGIEERAASALQHAATVAMRRYAYETADELLGRALQLRKALPAARVDEAAELDTISQLAGVRRARFGYQRASMVTPLQRAKDLARQTDKDLVLVELLWTEWAARATACSLDEARRLGLEMLDLAERSGDPLITATARSSWGIQRWHEGELADAMASLDFAIELFGPWRNTAAIGSATHDAPLSGLGESEFLARCFHAIVHELAGHPLPPGETLLETTPANLAPYQFVTVQVSEAHRAMVTGDHAAALHAGTAAVEVDLGEHFEFFRSAGRCLRGAALVQVGRAAEGVESLERTPWRAAASSGRSRS